MRCRCETWRNRVTGSPPEGDWLDGAQRAENLGVTRGTLSRILNGHGGISPAMTLALERIGWSNADYRMRLQASHDLARERCEQAA